MDRRHPALQSGSLFGLVPVYDARCVLAGATVVEILASPIKVPSVREQVQEKCVGKSHVRHTFYQLTTVPPQLSIHGAPKILEDTRK